MYHHKMNNQQKNAHEILGKLETKHSICYSVQRVRRIPSRIHSLPLIADQRLKLILGTSSLTTPYQPRPGISELLRSRSSSIMELQTLSRLILSLPPAFGNNISREFLISSQTFGEINFQSNNRFCSLSVSKFIPRNKMNS